MLRRLAPLTCFVLAAQSPPIPKYERPAPAQPVPFSHRIHAAQSLECKQCHPMPDPGDFAELPPVSFCMGCHKNLKSDSPHIQKLAGFHAENKPVPWARVYRVPDYVFFNHKRHLEKAGATCETCHGPVQERDALRRERDISMAACMDCHRSKNASNACNYCHDPR